MDVPPPDHDIEVWRFPDVALAVGPFLSTSVVVVFKPNGTPPELDSEWLCADVLLPPVSSDVSKSVSPESKLTNVLPAPKATQVPKPSNVLGFVDNVEI